MLKIIFGNIARKDHYYLNKKYIKKQHLALKVTEKIKKRKEKKISWVVLDLRLTRTRGRPEPDPSIHPTCPGPFGSGGLGWLQWWSHVMAQGGHGHPPPPPPNFFLKF